MAWRPASRQEAWPRASSRCAALPANSVIKLRIIAAGVTDAVAGADYLTYLVEYPNGR
jgi:hypothetical protein